MHLPKQSSFPSIGSRGEVDASFLQPEEKLANMFLLSYKALG